MKIGFWLGFVAFLPLCYNLYLHYLVSDKSFEIDAAVAGVLAACFFSTAIAILWPVALVVAVTAAVHLVS